MPCHKALKGRSEQRQAFGLKMRKLLPKLEIIFFMIIRNCTTSAPKGQSALSPGQRPGLMDGPMLALKGQKPYCCIFAFALTGRNHPFPYTQGVALGYEVMAFQADDGTIADNHIILKSENMLYYLHCLHLTGGSPAEKGNDFFQKGVDYFAFGWICRVPAFGWICNHER